MGSGRPSPEPRSFPQPLCAVALTRPGMRLAARLAEAFPGARALAPDRFSPSAAGVEGFQEPVAQLIARLWPDFRGFLLVMAAGVAVRSVAPLLGDKKRDPAVVVLDSGGRFAVPILSGHLGGANELAREVARRLGATAVITTATDALGRPSIEVWARERGLRIEGEDGVLRINAAWASGDPVGAYADPALGARGLGLVQALGDHLELATESAEAARCFPGELLVISHRADPGVGRALLLRPACLALGVGCRRGAEPAKVELGVREALAEEGLSPLAVKAVASVTAKAGEPALVRLAEALGVPFEIFSPEALSRVAVPTPSQRVREAVGTPSVSEAAALSAAGGGTLILPKRKGDGWTLAVAMVGPQLWSPFAPDVAPAADGSPCS